MAGACWSLSRALDTAPVLVAQQKFGLSFAASKALLFYLASMWACSFATMFYLCAASSLYDSRTLSSKLSAVVMRILFSFCEIGIWVAHEQEESGVVLSTVFWATIVRLFLYVPSESGFFLTLAQSVRTSITTGSGEHNYGCTPEEGHLDKGDEAPRENRQWLGTVLQLFTSMGACYLWAWTWLIFSLVVVPGMLPAVRLRSAWLATLFSICYPPLLCSSLMKGTKVFTQMFTEQTTTKRIEVYHFGVMVSTIFAEFMCKQSAYSASTLPETACILLGQMVSEVFSRWLMPHMITAKVALQEFCRQHSRGRPVHDGRFPRCGIASPDDDHPDDSSTCAFATDGHRMRESSLETAMVHAACLAESRNCMEYIAHCGVVAAKYADGDGMQGWDLAQAWLLAIGMEVASDMVFAFGKKWMNLAGTGRYPLPLNWTALGVIVAFSAEATFLCMM
eukprot:CAMPEP_0198513742 /NCGR_PEP_ID=MMETSP1462-20131121/16250_1 /TAXON_ID=1333877 /ORGANISM="Brandtodinium nutriculum, Strain RCC3387" /LENGTH=449 /DNA_ID=CAMNT_0044243167 /DNA_START=36 /DNA_END=1382 /DNA_ORIENTATION=+